MSVQTSRVRFVTFQALLPSLLLIKKHVIADLSLVLRGKNRWKDSGIGLWVVDMNGFFYGF